MSIPIQLSGAPELRPRVAALAAALPPLEGAPIQVRFDDGLRDRHGEVHAGACLRERRIACDPALRADAEEFARILCHELFHFVWLRLGNPARRAWEEHLAGELARGTRGELGWSSEWRKARLQGSDVRARTRRWREYCCESFCDTAAFLFASRRHPEFTLAPRHRAARRRWFFGSVVTKPLPL